MDFDKLLLLVNEDFQHILCVLNMNVTVAHGEEGGKVEFLAMYIWWLWVVMGVNVDGYNNLEGEQLDFYWEENKKKWPTAINLRCNSNNFKD